MTSCGGSAPSPQHMASDTPRALMFGAVTCQLAASPLFKRPTFIVDDESMTPTSPRSRLTPIVVSRAYNHSRCYISQLTMDSVVSLSFLKSPPACALNGFSAHVQHIPRPLHLRRSTNATCLVSPHAIHGWIALPLQVPWLFGRSLLFTETLLVNRCCEDMKEG